MNSNLLKSLFKPYELEFIELNVMMDVTGLSEKEMFKIILEDECSKSNDESCINTVCPHNFVNMHNEDLYIKISNELKHS